MRSKEDEISHPILLVVKNRVLRCYGNSEKSPALGANRNLETFLLRLRREASAASADEDVQLLCLLASYFSP